PCSEVVGAVARGAGRAVGPGAAGSPAEARTRGRTDRGDPRTPGRARGVPGRLPRARSEGRAVAAPARRPRVELRRPPDLPRGDHRPLGVQGRPAVEGWHRAVPGPRGRQAEGPGGEAVGDGRAAGDGGPPDPAAPGGRPGALGQEQVALAGRRAARPAPAARTGVARRVRPALQLPPVAGGGPRVAPRGHPAAEPRRRHSGEVRAGAPAAVHAGAGLTRKADSQQRHRDTEQAKSRERKSLFSLCSACSVSLCLCGSFMTYEEALAFWYGRINYEVRSARPGDLKLERMRALLRLLGDPHERLRLVHVTGTKGKGSTSAMLAAILRAAGYRVGLFTSPHLTHVEERMQVNGVPISREELTA